MQVLLVMSRKLVEILYKLYNTSMFIGKKRSLGIDSVASPKVSWLWPRPAAPCVGNHSLNYSLVGGFPLAYCGGEFDVWFGLSSVITDTNSSTARPRSSVNRKNIYNFVNTYC